MCSIFLEGVAVQRKRINKNICSMPGQVIDRPNPQPLASHIPDHVQDLAIKLQHIKLSDADLQGLDQFRRASNYIAAGEGFSFSLKQMDYSFASSIAKSVC